MNCVIKRKYWEKIYGCFILMKYVNKILVEEKCYSCEEKKPWTKQCISIEMGQLWHRNAEHER